MSMAPWPPMWPCAICGFSVYYHNPPGRGCKRYVSDGEPGRPYVKREDGGIMYDPAILPRQPTIKTSFMSRLFGNNR